MQLFILFPVPNHFLHFRKSVCMCFTSTVWTTPVLTISPSLWELLHVRPSAEMSRMYISPHGRSLMSQPVSDVVQQEVPPLICSSVALYVTAPGTADHEMLAVWFSQPTDAITSSGGQGAGKGVALISIVKKISKTQNIPLVINQNVTFKIY